MGVVVFTKVLGHAKSQTDSKTACANILKIASNHSKSSKYRWKVSILGRGCKKTKRPQQ